jgi:hypothetical protein
MHERPPDLADPKPEPKTFNQIEHHIIGPLFTSQLGRHVHIHRGVLARCLGAV